MVSSPDRFVFFQILPAEAETAFAFHHSQASTNPRIWPRKEEEIHGFAKNGELFGVRKFSTGELVALCYATLDESSQEYEIGGLTVAHSAEGIGIGPILVNCAVAYVIATEFPRKYQIIAHVHESNDEPRNLLKRIGFQHAGTVTAPDNAPASMKRNPQGKVVGDKFVFPRTATRQLSSWFDEFNGVVFDGKTPAVIDLELDVLRAVLRAEAADAEKG